MENTILFNSDGTFPIEASGNVLFYGGRLRKLQKPAVVRGGSALPKLMQNLQLFDSSVISSKGKGIQKPNFGPMKKPIKFII
jgi:hypothetical protein